MKQTIEINIPDGYELDSREQDSMVYDNPMKRSYVSVYIKQKQQKTFDWYVDQYLDASAGSTNDELRNWLNFDDVFVLSGRLKTKQYNLVPWEVKIGLVKFICKDKSLYVPSVIYDLCGETCDSSDTDKIRQICPIEFLNSIAL